jgi:hypothetical protein
MPPPYRPRRVSSALWVNGSPKDLLPGPDPIPTNDVARSRFGLIATMPETHDPARRRAEGPRWDHEATLKTRKPRKSALLTYGRYLGSNEKDGVLGGDVRRVSGSEVL